MSVRDLKDIEREKPEQTNFLRNGKPRNNEVLNSTSTSGSNPPIISAGMSTIIAPHDESQEQRIEPGPSPEQTPPLPRTSEDDLTDQEVVKKSLEHLRKKCAWFRDEF